MKKNTEPIGRRTRLICGCLVAGTIVAAEILKMSSPNWWIAAYIAADTYCEWRYGRG